MDIMAFKIPSKIEILGDRRKFLKGERKSNQFGYLKAILQGERPEYVYGISKTKDWELKHSAPSIYRGSETRHFLSHSPAMPNSLCKT